MGKKLDYIEILSRINERCIEEDMQCLKIIWNNPQNKNTSCKLKLRCLKCGNISTKGYANFITMEQGCKICKYNLMADNQTLPEEFVISQINKILKDKNMVFDSFDGGKYVSKKKTKVKIKCLKCGKISTSTYSEIYRRGLNCRYCENKQYTDEELIEILNERCIKNNVTLVKLIKGGYKNRQNKKVLLRCNNCGKEFTRYTNYLLYNDIKCNYCQIPSILEREIINALEENKINYIYQANNKNFKWLDKQSLDFYLPHYNVAIECQGKQHFNLGGWHEPFEKINERDSRKFELCNKHNVKLFYFTNKEISEELFLNEKLYKYSDELISDIMKRGSQ